MKFCDFAQSPFSVPNDAEADFIANYFLDSALLDPAPIPSSSYLNLPLRPSSTDFRTLPNFRDPHIPNFDNLSRPQPRFSPAFRSMPPLTSNVSQNPQRSSPGISQSPLINLSSTPPFEPVCVPSSSSLISSQITNNLFLFQSSAVCKYYLSQKCYAGAIYSSDCFLYPVPNVHAPLPFRPKLPLPPRGSGDCRAIDAAIDFIYALAVIAQLKRRFNVAIVHFLAPQFHAGPHDSRGLLGALNCSFYYT